MLELSFYQCVAAYHAVLSFDVFTPHFVLFDGSEMVSPEYAFIDFVMPLFDSI